jgi:hypothetical protein
MRPVRIALESAMHVSSSNDNLAAAKPSLEHVHPGIHSDDDETDLSLAAI